ncbi:Sulfur carrier protein FdhD [Arenibacter antarcticus]|uniref:Sulfur carrier protein FdhD n=1 Tax=Arenibacter antarcticus TaxID=2040469 RepID=A0ABW5VF15_9FLAO|nr:formate dehydrogenase accessory sulfurtransferase FdhD [Arenibacter sp. H213]MCM4169756.1 formate dehydrogenase accessory sulfurtransferase FdhD [Arenibacter sp. H213]
MKEDTEKSTITKKIIKVKFDETEEITDTLAVEEPLEISISVLQASPPISNKNISITMRTPGNDTDLAVGFLFTEGILATADQIDKISLADNTVHIYLNNSENIDLSKLERHFYTSSSCGVCGKASLEAIKTVSLLPPSSANFQVEKNLLNSFPEILNQQQTIFNRTGGIHAAALFELSGNILNLREDVGRHNALDKLIGNCFQHNHFPLDNHILFLSGRVSFELIQKAVMAGIHFIAAVGAPSSLAVEMAIEHDVTLVGFLSKTRYNIYNGANRIKI